MINILQKLQLLLNINYKNTMEEKNKDGLRKLKKLFKYRKFYKIIYKRV